MFEPSILSPIMLIHRLGRFSYNHYTMYFNLHNVGNPDDTNINFKELFDNPHLKINDLLSIKGIIAEVRNSGDNFSNLLIKRPDLTKALIDGALRPEAVGIENVEHSYLCSEIIAAQSEVFHQFVFASQQIQQQDVVKSEEDASPEGKKIFLYLFDVLDSTNELNRTVGGYLLRMFSQLQYQNPQEVFQQFVNNRQLLAKCIKHLSNPSVTQILTRVVGTYGQKVLKSPEKVRLAKEIFTYPFISEQALETKIQMIQNLQEFTEELVQKSNQFSQHICQQLISNKILDIVCQSIQKHKQQPNILGEIAELLSILAHFYIKQEAKEKKKVKHFVDIEDETEKQEPRVIEPVVLSKLVGMARTLFKCCKEKNYVQACKLLADISRINSNSQHFFLDSDLFRSYKELLIKNPHNNILHNHLKRVIIAGLKAKNLECLHELIDFINDTIQSPSELKNQLYYISLEINDDDVSKQCSSWGSVREWRQSTKKLYTQALPAQGNGVKKARQLNDFFTDQEQIISQDEDLSSEDRSPKHALNASEEVPEILIYSDDDRQNDPTKVLNTQNAEIAENVFHIRKARSIDIPDEVKEPKEAKQAKQAQPSPTSITPLAFWKKVLSYSLDTLLSDLNNS